MPRIPIISDVFGWLFDFFYGITQHQYLLTLLLFAIVVKAALLPFGIKQQKNSIKQARMRPKEMAIRRKYAGRTDQKTKQKMSEEIMQLYQEEHINPMGGCLPLLIQMPILFALYDVIRSPLTYILGYSKDIINKLHQQVVKTGISLDEISLVNEVANSTEGINVEGVDVNEIIELSQSFKFFGFDLTAIPEMKWGIYIIIPVLTFIFSFVSTKIIRKFTYQPQMGADAAPRGMGMMDFLMPLLSVWISIKLSAAIGIYWMFQNVLSAVQQVVLFKLYPVPAVTEEQIKEAELQLKGRSTKKREATLGDYEIDDYDKTTASDKNIKTDKKPEKNFGYRKAGISPKVKQIIEKNGNKPLKARRKI